MATEKITTADKRNVLWSLELFMKENKLETDPLLKSMPFMCKGK